MVGWSLQFCKEYAFIIINQCLCCGIGTEIASWPIISRTFSANEHYFSITTNQPIVLSAMAYQPSEQDNGTPSEKEPQPVLQQYRHSTISITLNIEQCCHNILYALSEKNSWKCSS